MNSIADYEKINKGFGALADEYDEMRFTNKPVQIMREKFYELVESITKPGADVLEINCGGGIDALHFSNKGYKVFATDISDKMLVNAETKNYNRKVEFKKLSFTELHKIQNRKFDLVYSNLGGLNCTDEFEKISREITNLLNSGGYFIAAVMPNFFLWEFLLFVKGEFARALRRLNKNWIEANVGGEKIKVKYYSPRRFKKYFMNDFSFIKTKALRIFAPPPPAGKFYSKHPRLSKLLDKIDDRIEDFYLSSYACDYYIIVFKKKN